MSSILRVLEPEVMDDPAEARAYDAMDHREANGAFVDRLAAVWPGFQSGAGGEAGGGAGGDVTDVLDLGCGPGDIPLTIRRRWPGARVTGVDLAATMLAIARAKLAAESPQVQAGVVFTLADVKALPMSDASFDLVVSNTILHHIPKPIMILQQAARVTRPGGAVVIRDLFRPPDEAVVDSLVDQHAAQATPEQRLMFRNSLIAALTPAELADLAAAAGMPGAAVTVDTDRHMTLQWFKGL